MYCCPVSGAMHAQAQAIHEDDLGEDPLLGLTTPLPDLTPSSPRPPSERRRSSINAPGSQARSAPPRPQRRPASGRTDTTADSPLSCRPSSGDSAGDPRLPSLPSHTFVTGEPVFSPASRTTASRSTSPIPGGSVFTPDNSGLSDGCAVVSDETRKIDQELAQSCAVAPSGVIGRDDTLSAVFITLNPTVNSRPIPDSARSHTASTVDLTARLAVVSRSTVASRSGASRRTPASPNTDTGDSGTCDLGAAAAAAQRASAQHVTPFSPLSVVRDVAGSDGSTVSEDAADWGVHEPGYEGGYESDRETGSSEGVFAGPDSAYAPRGSILDSIRMPEEALLMQLEAQLEHIGAANPVFQHFKLCWRSTRRTGSALPPPPTTYSSCPVNFQNATFHPCTRLSMWLQVYRGQQSSSD